MKKTIIYLSIISILFTLSSCSKNDPTPEIDQEEVSQAKLFFTEVELKPQAEHNQYQDVIGGLKESISFTGANYLPPIDTHLHLEVGKTYRLELIAKDFAGRETQHTFVDRADTHQAFLLGAPSDVINYWYADKSEQGEDLQVGVTGYLKVKALSDKFVLRYIMRHLNAGVKSKIKKTDWNNNNYTQFTGDNDLDLHFEIHVVSADHDH